MSLPQIILTVLGGILLLLILLFFLGKARIRIRFRERLRVVAYVCGVPITLISDKKEKEEKKDLSRCRNPEQVLKKELRKRKKAAQKALKKAMKKKKKAAEKALAKAKEASLSPKLNLKERLEMTLAILKELRKNTTGKINIRVRRMQILVATNDAAKTAILYGTVVQSAAFLLEWIDKHFNRIHRKDGAMSIEPDYTKDESSAEIDLECSMYISQALGLLRKTLSSIEKEKSAAKNKARARIAKKQAKKQN